MPEWILSEVAVLSRLSCVRLKLITRQVINELTGGRLDIDKVCKLAPKESGQLIGGDCGGTAAQRAWAFHAAGFEPSDIRATLAAIRWILVSATRYSVDEAILNNELQQLGLPKENSDGLSRPFRIHRDRLHAQALENALRLPRLASLSWRTDAVLYDSVVGDMRGPRTAAPPTRGSTKQVSHTQQHPVPVHHLRLGLSHTLGGRYPEFPATGAQDTPLLVAHRGGLAEAATSWPVTGDDAAAAPLLALGIRPIFHQGKRSSALVPQAQLEFALSQDQLGALLAELGAARGLLSEAIAAAAPQS